LRIKKFTSQSFDSITISEYPTVHSEFIKPEVEKEIEWLKSIIQTIRTIRSEMSITPNKVIPLILRNVSKDNQQHLETHHKLLVTMSKVSPITCLNKNESVPPAATGVVDGLEIFIPMADLIDKKAELARLKKEIAKLEKDKQVMSGKLSNDSFINKAPADVIAKEKERLHKTEHALSKLYQQLTNIEQLDT